MDHDEVVDLPGATALSLPVVKLRTVARARVYQAQLLSRQLVGELAAHGGCKVGPAGEGGGRWRPEERVSQPDVRENGLAEGVLRLGAEGQTL